MRDKKTFLVLNERFVKIIDLFENKKKIRYKFISYEVGYYISSFTWYAYSYPRYSRKFWKIKNILKLSNEHCWDEAS